MEIPITEETVWRGEKWIPLTPDEILKDRHWWPNVLREKLLEGKLKVTIRNQRLIYLEPHSERAKYLYLRKFPAAKYEREERELASMLGIPYYREAQPEESGWTVGGVFRAIWFILEILMLPFTILGMRDGAQWFLGTGEYAKGHDDDFV